MLTAMSLVAFFLVGIAAIFPAMMSPMAFDSPGSGERKLLVAMVVGLVILPVVLLIGAAGASVAWIYSGEAAASTCLWFFFKAACVDAVLIVACAGLGSKLA